MTRLENNTIEWIKKLFREMNRGSVNITITRVDGKTVKVVKHICESENP